MRVLGIDPGPTDCGYAVIDTAGAVLAHGKVPSDEASLAALFDRVLAAGPVELVAIETVEGYAYEPKRTAALIATARVEGVLVSLAGARGLAVAMRSARVVRKALTGKANAADRTIKVCLATPLDLPRRSNVHARDAMAVAVVAALVNPDGTARRLVRVRINAPQLPPAPRQKRERRTPCTVSAVRVSVAEANSGDRDNDPLPTRRPLVSDDDDAEIKRLRAAWANQRGS